MVCPNCGETLPDGSRFCGNCGKQLASQTPKEQASAFASPVRAPFSDEVRSQRPDGRGAEDFVGIKKRRNVKKIAVLCTALVVLACAALLLARTLLSAGTMSNATVTLSNGKYYLIRGQKGEPIEFANIRNGSDDFRLASFSPDHRYVYYFTRVDDSSSTGTLCRVEYKKLRAGSGKNETYTEVIASNVSIGPLTFLDSGTVLYENSDSTLYCFDGRDTMQISRDVDAFIAEGSTIVYTTGNYADGYSLYSASTRGTGEKVKLVSGFDSLNWFNNVNGIVYSKLGDDDSTALYLTGVGRETVKIASNAEIIPSYMGLDSLYFTDSDPAKNIPLYDFISDPDADADADAQEPDADDFRIVTYNYQRPSLDGLGEEAYPDLYSSIEVIQNTLEGDYGGVSEEVVPLLQQFQDRFFSAINADGYVSVTGEVRDLLKNILTTGGQDPARWGYLCRVREASRSTDYDYEAYYAALESYSESQSRNQLRETLKDRKNGVEVSTLYRISPDGTVTTVLDNVAYATSAGATIFCVMMPNSAALSEKLPFSRVYENSMSVYNVHSWISDAWLDSAEVVMRVVPINPDTSVSTPLTLSAKAVDWVRDLYDSDTFCTVCVSGERAFMMLDDATLWSAAISGGTLGEVSQAADDVDSIRFDDKSLFYFGNVYRSGDMQYGDFYAYRNGTRSRVAQDILTDYSLQLYADGVVAASTSYRNGHGYELTLFSGNGNRIIIGDDIQTFSRLSKSALLYLSEGDLRLYDGKNRTMLQEDVDQFWTMGHMETTLPAGYLDEYSYFNYGSDN